jgi:hypothetical protein
MAEILVLICPTARAEYFSRGGWTGFGVICPSRLGKNPIFEN